MKKHSTKRVVEFLNAIDWFFDLNSYDKEVICKDVANGNVIAEITCDDVYRWVQVRLYPVFFTKTLEEQRKALLHEFCHSITLPSKDAMCELADGKLITPQRINSINETATSRIENMLDVLFRGRATYAPKAYADYLKKK